MRRRPAIETKEVISLRRNTLLWLKRHYTAFIYINIYTDILFITQYMYTHVLHYLDEYSYIFIQYV